MNNVQLIIPMAGLGQRFVNAGYTDPKPMIMVDGKPIIQHIIEMFENPDDVTFICNENHIRDTNIRQRLLEISPNAKILSIPRQRGPVEGVQKVFDCVNNDKEVIVSYCDYGTVWDYQEFLNQARKKYSDGAIACYTGFHPHMLGSDNYAFVKMDGDYVEKIQEKQPFTNDKMSELASNGTYYFRTGAILKKYFHRLIDLDIKVKDEFYVSMVYNLMINDGLLVTTGLIEKMLQWGTPHDLEIYKEWSEFFHNRINDKVTAVNPPNTTLILPMAGAGSRFCEYSLPKPLVPVDGNPMFVEAVKCLPKSDNSIFLCLTPHYEMFNIDDIIYDNFNGIVYVIDKVTNGQACTCEIATKTVNPYKSIFISACDNGVRFNSDKYQKLVDDISVDVIVWTHTNSQAVKNNPLAYSYVDLEGDDDVWAVYTKRLPPSAMKPERLPAIVGSFFFRQARFFTECLHLNYAQNVTTNGEYYVDDVINQCIKSGLRVKIFEVDHYLGWGTPNDYKTFLYWSEYFRGRA